MSCFKSTAVRNSNYVDKLNAKFEHANVANGTVQEKIHWDSKMLDSVNKLAEDLADNQKKMVKLSSEFWERCEKQRVMRESLETQRAMIMKSAHYTANNNNSNTNSQNVIHSIESPVSMSAPQESKFNTNRRITFSDNNWQANSINASASAPNFQPQHNSFDAAATDDVEVEDVTYGAIFSECSTRSTPSTSQITPNMINARAEMFGKQLAEMASVPIPLAIDCCTNAIKSMKAHRKQALTDKDLLHAAKAKLKKQELKDDDKETVEVVQLQSKVDAIKASCDHSHELYCSQFTHFGNVEMATLQNNVEKSMHNMLLWQIRKSYEFLDKWFLQKSILRLEDKNSVINRSKMTSDIIANNNNNSSNMKNNNYRNNESNNNTIVTPPMYTVKNPTSALTVYVDPNAPPNGYEGRTNYMIDDNTTNTRNTMPSIYNGNNANNCYMENNMANMRRVSNVDETNMPVARTETLNSISLSNNGISNIKHDDAIVRNNINNNNSDNNTILNTNDDNNNTAKSQVTRQTVTPEANKKTNENNKAKKQEQQQQQQQQHQQQQQQQQQEYPLPGSVTNVAETSSVVPKPVERNLNGMMNEAAASSSVATAATITSDVSNNTHNNINNNNNNDNNNDKNTSNTSNNNKDTRSSMEVGMSTINRILVECGVDNVETVDLSATSSTATANGKMPPTTHEWTESAMLESKTSECFHYSEWEQRQNQQSHPQESIDGDLDMTPTVVNPSKKVTKSNINIKHGDDSNARDDLVKTPPPERELQLQTASSENISNKASINLMNNGAKGTSNLQAPHPDNSLYELEINNNNNNNTININNNNNNHQQDSNIIPTNITTNNKNKFSNSLLETVNLSSSHLSLSSSSVLPCAINPISLPSNVNEGVADNTNIVSIPEQSCETSHSLEQKRSQEECLQKKKQEIGAGHDSFTTTITPLRLDVVNIDSESGTECAKDFFSTESHTPTVEVNSHCIATSHKDYNVYNSSIEKSKATRHRRSLSDASVQSVTSLTANANRHVQASNISSVLYSNIHSNSKNKPSAPKESVEPVRDEHTFTIRNITRDNDEKAKEPSLPHTKITQRKVNKLKK